jgi:hypothetical protein
MGVFYLNVQNSLTIRHVLGHRKGAEVSVIRDDIRIGPPVTVPAPPGTTDAGARARVTNAPKIDAGALDEMSQVDRI